jgi:predicted GIY-YIG superfamily endonuclease
MGRFISASPVTKELKRDWKLKLIEDMNPNWEDLCDGLTGSRLSPG